MRKVLYIFGQLSDSDVQWLIQNGRKECLPAGAVLIKAGVPVEELFIVIEGSLAVCMADAPDEVIADLGSGEIVGEMSFVDSSLPSATVKVRKAATLYAIRRSRLLEKINGDAGFAARFYHAIAIFLADRLRSTLGLYEYRVTRKTRTALRDEDELDEMVTDSFVIAGERFKRILDQMMRM